MSTQTYEDFLRGQAEKAQYGVVIIPARTALDMADFIEKKRANGTDINVGSTISRDAAIDAINSMFTPTPIHTDMKENCLEIIENLPPAQPSPIWHETYDDDPASFQDDDRTVLVSFENFSQPMLGQWRHDPDIGGAWYIGDTDETFIENDLFVDGWWELPKKPEVKG